MLVETKAKVGVFAIALGANLPQFPTPVSYTHLMESCFEGRTSKQGSLVT